VFQKRLRDIFEYGNVKSAMRLKGFPYLIGQGNRSGIGARWIQELERSDISVIAAPDDTKEQVTMLPGSEG
jgi:hypothetical protein